MEVDLSFIIVNWNTKGLTLQAMASVVETVHDRRYEMVIIDNGSADGSPEAIAERFPQAQLILNAENQGYARAVNQGLSRAQGTYVILLNSDAVLMGGAVKALVDFMDEHPDVGVAGGQLLNEDGTKQNTIAPFPSLATELVNKRVLRILFPGKYPGKEGRIEGPLDVDSLVGACLAVRRRAVEEVGGLDESYFVFMEETDWCLRMHRSGWRVCFVPSAEAVHLQGATAGSVKAAAKKEFYRSRYHFFSVHRGAGSATVLKGLLMLRLALEVCADSFLVVKRRYRDRWRLRWNLLYWHLRACPANEGLRGVEYAATAHEKN